MTENELNKKLNSIRKDMHFLDSIVNIDYSTGEDKLTEKQVEIVRELFKIFSALNWQLAFNSYKEIVYDKKPVIQQFLNTTGTPVKICPCAKEYKGKTYFGILLGDIASSMNHTIDDKGVVTATHAMYNPAIFVPELKKIIFGYESWWGEITSKKDLKKLITKETIKNVWYVKALEALFTPKKKK